MSKATKQEAAGVVETAVKRGRGRPKGSKNKPKIAKVVEQTAQSDVSDVVDAVAVK